MKASSDEMHQFVTVVRHGSISAAAAQLHMTPSAVSRSLARLEQKLSTTLLNRTTRRMELTEEGRFFMERAEHILHQMTHLEAQLEACRQTPAGRLSINAATPFMLHAIVPYLEEFRERFPHIHLELTTDERNIDLLEQRTDVAIRIGALEDSSLHARALGTTQRFLVASPAYLERHGTPDTVESLRHHQLLGFAQLPALNRWPLPHPSLPYFEISPSLCASNGETLRQLALHGHGIACLSHFMLHHDLVQGSLLPVLGTQMQGAVQPIHAVYYRNTALSQRIRCFLDFIQEKLLLLSSH